MTIFEEIAKKTNFCVGLGCSSLIWALLAAGVGLGCDYIAMKENHMELFWSCVFLAVTWAPVVFLGQFFMLGLIKPLTLKSFRPLNQYIIGLDLAPGITIDELKELIDALKKFTFKFSLFAFLMSTIALSVFVANAIIRGEQTIYVLSQVVIGAATIMTYTVSSFLYGVGKTDLVRRKAYYLLAEFKKLSPKVRN